MTQARVELLADSRQVQRATDDLKQLENRGKSTTTVTNQLRNAFVALGGALAVREVARLADTYTNIQNRLRIVTGSTQELASVQQQLLDVANRSRAEFETTAGLYSTLARSTEELGLSQDRLLRVTETINKAFAASGADAATAAGAIRQLGQGLASGALRGDEFNSVAEGAPEIMRAIAAETGMTIGALREFAAEGKITSELLITALENYGDTVDDIFAKSERTISQAFQEARNNAIQFIGGIEAVDDAATTFGDAIVSLSENLDTLADAGIILAGVFGARLGGALASNVAAFTAAQIQAVRYQATLASMAGVSRATAVSLTTMGVAARGAGAAMAFLGGPVGVFLLAAGSAAYFASQVEDIDDKLHDLNEAAREAAGGIDALTAAQARNQEQELLGRLGRLIDRSKELKDELREAQEARNTTSGSGFGLGGFAEAQNEVSRLSEELKLNAQEQANLEALIARLANRQLAAAEATREQAKATQEQADSKALDKIIQGLDDQIYALKNGEAAYEVMRAAREANIALDSPEANGIRERIAERERLTQAIRDEAQAERERQQLREGVTGIVNDLSIGDDPAAQAEDEMFARLSVIDNALAAEAITKEEHRQAELLAEQAYQDRLTEIDAEAAQKRADKDAEITQARVQAQNAMYSQMLGLTQNVFGSIADAIEQAKGRESTAFKVAFLATKAAAIAQAVLQTELAATTALAPPPFGLGPVAGLGYANVIRALGYASVGIMAGQAIGEVTGGRALGGQALAGNQYLVGERGPELVTMGSNGNVTPYNQLMREARGSQQAPQQNVRVIVENYGSERATTSESVVNDERIIRVVVGNINARREVHGAITRTTTANNKVGA